MKKIVSLSVVLLVLVIPAVVSADTLIVYTTGTDDGGNYRQAVNETIAVVVAGAGTNGGTTGSQDPVGVKTSDGYSKNFGTIYRVYRNFNTSDIPDDAIINSAILGGYGHTSTQTNAGAFDVGVTGWVPSSNISPVSTDYNTYLSVILSDYISSSSWSTSGNNNFTLNSDGLTYISKISYTNLMIRTKWDILSTTSGMTDDKSSYSRVYVQNVEHGSTGKPFLEIVYSLGISAPVASFTANKNFIRIPNLISVTDTSTNTPTSWEWSWGDGTANSTTQNPTHQYLKRGRFPIVLTATNAGGSGATTAYNVRVAGYEN